MSKQTINIGASPNDGTGTPLRTSFDYTNQNFTEIYTALGGGVALPGATTQVIFNDGGTNLAGDAGLVYNKTTDALTVAGLVTAGSATITGDLTVDTNVLKVDSTLNKVGIGVATLTGLSTLNVAGDIALTSNLVVKNSGGTIQGYIFGSGGLKYQVTASNHHVWQEDGTDLMRLNSTGLGIGRGPLTSLDVFGANKTNANEQGTLTVSSSDAFAIDKGGSIAFWGKYNTASGNACFARVYGAKENATDGNFVGYFAVATGGGGSPVERFRIDSSGNVGIGVTPSAWNTSYKALQIGAIGSLSSVTTNMLVGANYFRSASADTYIANGLASLYLQSAGIHYWYTAPSGTAGNAITFTQAMGLDASGNLLVGFASNPNTARAYFRYDTLTTQPVINSASVVAASTAWSHFIGQSGNGSSITTSNIFIYGNGNIQNTNGVYGTISDLRLKENIADARNYLSDLLKLRVVKYSLKEEASAVANKLGFIAQEVEQVFPAMVDTDPNDGNKGIKTSVLIPMLVKAIQELTTRVQTLEAR